MAVSIFPQNGDTGGETAFQNLSRYGGAPKRVESDELALGYFLSSGLNVNIESGDCVINGVHLSFDSITSLTLPDNSTFWICVQLDRSSGLVQNYTSDSDAFITTSNTADIADADTLPLFYVTTSGGAVTQVTDVRWLAPGAVMAETPNTFESFSGTSLTDAVSLRAPGLSWGAGVAIFRFEIVLNGLDDSGIKFALTHDGAIRWRYRLFEDGTSASIVDADAGLGGGTSFSVSSANFSVNRSAHLIVEARAITDSNVFYPVIPQFAEDSAAGSVSYSQNSRCFTYAGADASIRDHV